MHEQCVPLPVVSLRETFLRAVNDPYPVIEHHDAVAFDPQEDDKVVVVDVQDARRAECVQFLEAGSDAPGRDAESLGDLDDLFSRNTLVARSKSLPQSRQVGGLDPLNLEAEVERIRSAGALLR